MLPPVLASANQITTATEPKQRPDQIATTRQVAASPSVTSARIDQSSAIAGQLNIMLLSGPERMSQNLAALADVLGSALKIERRSDESLNDYMGRLIEGIAALPAGDRAKLQKLLTQAFAGLQLRTLLEAMASPSGPERATLALYLELYRQKDGDGATRSVISSYRELAGEARSSFPSTGRPAAANDGLRPTGPPAPAAAKTPPPLSPSALSVDGLSQPEARPSSAASIQDPRTPSSPVRSQSPEAALIQGKDQVRALPSETTGLRPASVPAAERGLSQAPASPQASRDLSAPTLPPIDRRGRSEVPQSVALSADRTVARRGEERVDTMDASVKTQGASPLPILSASSGAKPDHPPGGGWLAELLETDIVRTLLALKSLSADTVRSQPQPVALHGTTSEAQSPPAAEPARQNLTDETESASRMHEAGPVSDAAETDTPPQSLPLAEQAAIRPMLSREGVPLPFISYLIEDQVPWEEEVREEDERGAEDEEHSQDQGQQKGEEPSEEISASDEVDDRPAGQATVSALPHGDARGTEALPAPSVAAVQLPLEPAHELYLRMAGLT